MVTVFHVYLSRIPATFIREEATRGIWSRALKPVNLDPAVSARKALRQRNRANYALICTKCDVSLRKQARQPFPRGFSRHGARPSEIDNFGRKSARGNLATLSLPQSLIPENVTQGIYGQSAAKKASRQSTAQSVTSASESRRGNRFRGGFRAMARGHPKLTILAVSLRAET